MLKNKKSSVFNLVLLVGVIIAAATIMISLPKSGEFILGSKQGDILKTHQSSQKALLYVDQSAKYSYHQAIYDLAKNGGCSSSEFSAYGLWDFSENSKCNAGTETAKKSFIGFFTSNINGFLSGYNPVKMPLNNYDIGFKDNSITGMAINPFKITINSTQESGKQEKIAEYSVKPSFRINMDYDFSDYDKLRNKAQELMNLCKSRNLDSCVNINKFNVFNTDNFELIDKCETEEKDQFYKVIDYINSCSNSDDKSCICTSGNPSGKGSFEISQDGNDIKISTKSNAGLKEKISNIKLLEQSYVFISGASYVHKDHDGKVIISGYWTGKTCEAKPKTTFRFCAKSNDKKYYAYDNENKKTEFRNIIYKFALDFGHQSIEINEAKALTSEDTIKLLQDKNIVITSECPESQEILDLANNLGNLMAKTGAVSIVPLWQNKCSEISDKEAFKQNYFSKEKQNILITLSSGQPDKVLIEYYMESQNSETKTVPTTGANTIFLEIANLINEKSR